MKVYLRTWRNGTTTHKAWMMDFRHNGTRHRRALPTATSRQKAEELAAQYYTQATTTPNTNPQNHATLAQILTLDRQRPDITPQTALWESYCARHLTRGLGPDLQPSQLNQPLLNAYKTARRKTAAVRTVNMELQVLRAALNRLIASGQLTALPCPIKALPNDPTPRRYLTRPQLQAILEAAKTHTNPRWGPITWLHPALTLLLNLGLRRSELFRLTWSHVDLPRQTIQIRTRKRGSASGYIVHTLPLNPPALAVLTQLHRQTAPADPDPIIPPGTGRHRPRNHLGAMLKQLAKTAGIPWHKTLRLHDLRHAFAMACLETGAQLADVSALMRHSTPATTLALYTHASASHMRTAVDAIWAHDGRKATRSPKKTPVQHK